jgi:probable rRNA maturation factor
MGMNRMPSTSTFEEEYSFCTPHAPQAAELEVQLYRDVAVETPEDSILFQAFVEHCPSLLEAMRVCIQSFKLYKIHGLTFPSEAQPWLLEWILCNDADIQQLNHAHRSKDAPTDVLSFPLYESSPDAKRLMEDEGVPDFSKQYGGSLGSVVVSWEYAKTHAPLGQQLAYIIERFIHGTLHVLGQHHDDDASFKRVMELQSVVLHALNLESTLLPYDDAYPTHKD